MRIPVTLALGLLLMPAIAGAQAGIRVYEVTRIRIDGSLDDWRAATFSDVGRGRDASFSFALGADDRGLYVAARVRDDRLVRTSARGTREDALILTLALPQRRGGRRIAEIYLFAGVPGRSAGSAGIANRIGGRPRPIRGARVVEGPLRRGSGYVLEAFIPFDRIPGSARWDQALATIRLRDVDSEAHPVVESEPAFVDPEALVPLLPTGGAGGALEQFLAQRDMGATRPAHDLRGNVSGDRRPERVFVVGRYVLVTGPGYRNGQGYAYHELPVASARDIRSAELRDLTGDGRAELVIVLRQRNQQGERDLWQVISFSGDSPTPVFGIEIRKVIGGGSVEARVTIHASRGRGPPEIEVRAYRARGLDAESYHETPAADVEPILLPWGPIASRRYRFRGGGFTRVGDRPNPDYRPPEPHRSSGREATPVEPPPPPRGPSGEELIAAFRRQRHIRRGIRPSHRFRSNFAGGREPETAHVYGRHLVMVGPGIQGGLSWLYYEIPAPTDADVIDVSAADVTGDRRAELIFRIRQTFGEVRREVLLIHQLRDDGFPRILEVEVARAQGTASIRNDVRTTGGRLEIRPGAAREWNEQTYRFTRDPDDSAEPLLLPWIDRPVRYRLRRGRLAH